MASIAERIKQLRTLSGMTQEEFGNKFGIVKSTVSLYESGKSTPNDQIKIKICEYFNIQLDYLLGISDSSSYSTNANSGFLFDFRNHDNFLKLLEKKNISIEILSDKTGIDLDLLKSWFSPTAPTLQQLVVLADELQTSIDYLLGRVEYSYAISDDDMDMIDYYKQLSKIDQRWIVGQMIDILKQNHNKDDSKIPVAAGNLKEAK